MQRMECLRWQIVFTISFSLVWKEVVCTYLKNVGFLVVAYPPSKGNARSHQNG